MPSKKTSFTLSPELNLLEVYGADDTNLKQITDGLHIDIEAIDNNVEIISHSKDKRKSARGIIEKIADMVKKGEIVNEHVIANLIAEKTGFTAKNDNAKTQTVISEEFNASALTMKSGMKIAPRNESQIEYMEGIANNEIIFGAGPAGTGKTYLAVAAALHAFENDNKIKRIVLVRPAVEAGEKIGFLPGDMEQKVDPYMRPLYDALYEMKGNTVIDNLIKSNEIEIAVLGFMRGRTLKNSFIIFDEAQNSTEEQMKMLLTRMGDNSKIIIAGDVSQSDLPRGTRSGLEQALIAQKNTEGVYTHHFEAKHVVRNAMVLKMINAYDALEEHEETLKTEKKAAPIAISKYNQC